FARLRPPSMSGIARMVPASGPSAQVRLDHLKRLDSSEDSKPPSAVRLRTGKNAAFATPMRAFAAAMVRLAAAMSGRRSSSDEGRPAGIAGMALANDAWVRLNAAAG